MPGEPAPTVAELRDRPEAGERPRPTPAIVPELIDADQLAALLNVHPATVYRMQSRGRLPAPLRLSRGCVRWRLGEIRDWLAAGAPPRREWEARRGAANGRR
jgi:predicted DNA-binding transcriptional regulator AlpA